jgi:hypothetical protein
MQRDAAVAEFVLALNNRYLLYAAQYGAYPGNDFSGAKRFAYIIIGADLKAYQPVDLVHLGRKHHDRQVRKLSDLSTNAKPIFAREHQVQNEKVWLFGPYRFYGIGTVM